ncbi:hypothetical protein BBK36DRAFT_1115017 [Trichoderma citrinoviride]|uniref:Uncharacterized protein n=1 Tax=Trichoderma citrinoviride TaxID=58853 RepID=A0A2T4BFZ8_9HYPO|nr:hypothetical protein BBK36DRAFT_1115017 [Trichoderma citrinoviride]PTB68244.1 hypothetical protein BBK36DRAFT_1115017 [Trichoderma citrinoviride]
MAPIRRYLRITKYSVLECRIYLDSPALAQSWLLNPRDPILPKVIEAIRPLVIPKLREEKERSKKKSTKKKTIKDVIPADDFEVSVFLMETDTRHSLLSKHKFFREKGPSALQSNASKLIAETNANPIDVDASDFAPIRIEEDSDNEGVTLSDIPSANTRRQAKRQRSNTLEYGDDDEFEDASDDADSVVDVDSDGHQPLPKRARGLENPPAEPDEDDYKKKLAMDVSYEGFAIYGRVLCLVVKKKESKPQQALGGQAKMENWITSTQIPVGEEAS